MNHPRAHRVAHLLVAAVLGIAAFTLVLTATDPPGPGLDPDAMAYLGAAESLAGHATYRVPAAGWDSADSTSALTHFPPGYSTALALPVRLGMPGPQAARLVDALAAAVTIGAVVLLLAATTSLAAGALLGVALMVTPALAIVHLSVLSEPLFLACSALTLAAMARRDTHPVALGLPAALGALTRYAGVALVGAAVLWALAIPGTMRARARRGLLALLPAALLQGAWVIRTRLLHEPGEIRHVAFYGRLWPTLVQGAATLRDWLIPDPDAWSEPLPHRAPLAIAAALLVALLVAEGTRRARASRGASPGAERAPGSPARLLAACALLGACYLGLLVVSRLFADPGIPFDERILSPLLLVASVAVAAATAEWWRTTPRVLPRVALAAALACWMAASAWTTWGEVDYALEWGSDFAGEQWRRSEVLAWARGEGATHPLYTNWPSAVYFHLHRPSRYVPGARDADDLAEFADTLRAHDGRVLLFSMGDADYLSATALLHAPDFRVVETLEDGVVFQAAPARR
jgi:hypothetical protein